jgi:hypothetical protein
MAKLSYKRRQKLKSSEFAEPGERKFPIMDKAHARNALARVSQSGSSGEKATVRKKVHAKYPGIEVSGTSKGRATKGRKKRSTRKISLRKG